MKQLSDKPLTRKDQEFLHNIETQFISFIKERIPSLELEPMNSYYRRLTHKLAGLYGLFSESFEHANSEEQGPEKIITVSRTPETEVLKRRVVQEAKVETHDMGDQVFLVVPGSKVVLREDGSFGVPAEDDRSPVITEREVPERAFRIRNNQIVCPGEPNW